MLSVFFLKQVVHAHEVECDKVLVHVALYAREHHLFGVDAHAGEVAVELRPRCNCLGVLPDVAAACAHEPLAALIGQFGEVLSDLILVQPLGPAAALVDKPLEGRRHVREHGDLTLSLKSALKGVELLEGFIFADGELRAYVCSAHSAERIFFRIAYTVGVVTLNPASVRTYLRREVACDFRVEDRGVEVCSDLSNDEAWPYVGQTDLGEAALQLCKECVESSLIGQTAVNFLSSNFVRNFGEIMAAAEILNVPD